MYNTETTLNFIKTTKTTENMIDLMTRKKIEEFMIAHTALFNRLDTFLEQYFPKEITELIDEYIKNNRRVLVIDDALWIDVYGDRVRVRLNPNKYTSVSYQEGCRNMNTYTPVELNGLKTCVKRYNEYLLLEKILKDSIDALYDELCCWKTSKIEEQFKTLNELNFPGIETKPERYKVSIIIERM